MSAHERLDALLRQQGVPVWTWDSHGERITRAQLVADYIATVETAIQDAYDRGYQDGRYYKPRSVAA